MCTYFKTETEDYSIGKSKKYGVWGQFLKQRKLCLQNLTKEWKQPPVVILQQANFCNIFILCLWIRIIRKSDPGVQLMNFPSQIFFNDISHGFKAALLNKKVSVVAFVLCGCGFSLLLRKKANECALLKIGLSSSKKICVVYLIESPLIST